MDDQERTDIERDVYVSLRDYMDVLLSAERRRLDERFEAQEKANDLKREELSRRLEVLNHAHEQAREKEADFISREAYDGHVQRNLDQHAELKSDIKNTADVLAARVESEAKALATALADTQRQMNERVTRLENFQSKLLGLALAAPFVSALAVYLITQ